MEISKAMEISMGLNFGYRMEFSMGHGNFHGGPYFKFQDHGNFHGVGNFHGGPYFTSDGRCHANLIDANICWPVKILPIMIILIGVDFDDGLVFPISEDNVR